MRFVVTAVIVLVLNFSTISLREFLVQTYDIDSVLAASTEGFFAGCLSLFIIMWRGGRLKIDEQPE